jgi:hypothetical protein
MQIARDSRQVTSATAFAARLTERSIEADRPMLLSTDRDWPSNVGRLLRLLDPGFLAHHTPLCDLG